MAYTVAELAEKVKRPGENVPALIARLRNWTKEGLLVPEGERNPGIGRSRFYSDDSVATARFLSVLADIVGLPAVKSRSLQWVLANASIPFSAPPHSDLYLVIARPIDGLGGSITLCRSKQELLNAITEHPAHVVIDLKNYFEQLGSEEK